MVPVVIILLPFCWELGGGEAVINAGLMDSGDFLLKAHFRDGTGIRISVVSRGRNRHTFCL